jgi:hypothetical protein
MLLDMGVDPQTGAFEGRTAAQFAEQIKMAHMTLFFSYS